MNVSNQTMKTLFDHKLKLVEQIVLGSIFIVALICNTIVLTIMLMKRHRRITRMAFFILHLTIADLLVAFFSVLPMLIWKSTITFFGGDLLCRIIVFLMLAVSYISVYTLVAMANDRYQAIVHPLSTYTWTSHTGQTHMVGVWCLSLLLATPQLFIFRLAYHPAYGKKTCMANFLGPNRTWELIYIAWTIILQFILPVCLLIFFYSSVYIIVNKNCSMSHIPDNQKTTNSSNSPRSIMKKRYSNSVPVNLTIIDTKPENLSAKNIRLDIKSVKRKSLIRDSIFNESPASEHRAPYPIVLHHERSQLTPLKLQGISSIEREQLQLRYGASNYLLRARLKTIKLTFIVVVTYMLCSTPFYIGSIIMALHEKFISQKIMNWLMTIFSLLFNLNSCSNPIICLILSGTLFGRKSKESRKVTVPPSRKPSKTSMRTERSPLRMFQSS